MKKRQFWSLTLKGQLSWGKHKGRSHQWVIDNDPEYLVWLVKNVTIPLRFKKDFETYWTDKMNYSLHDMRIKSGLACRKQLQ